MIKIFWREHEPLFRGNSYAVLRCDQASESLSGWEYVTYLQVTPLAISLVHKT